MRSKFRVAAVGLFVATSSIALATGASAARRGAEEAPVVTANQIVDRFDAELARLRADLRLTPDQERNWSDFQKTMHDMASARADAETRVASDRDAADTRATIPPDNRAPAPRPDNAPVAGAPAPDQSARNEPAYREPPPPAPNETTGTTQREDDGFLAALAARADTYSAMADDLKKTASAARPLYESLDRRQRVAFVRFIRRDFEEMYEADSGGREGR